MNHCLIVSGRIHCLFLNISAQKQTPAGHSGEEFLYEEMNAFKQRPEPSSVSVQDSRRRQETVDTQDKVLEPENHSPQTDGNSEFNLYVEMKKISSSFTTTTTLCPGYEDDSCCSSGSENLSDSY